MAVAVGTRCKVSPFFFRICFDKFSGPVLMYHLLLGVLLQLHCLQPECLLQDHQFLLLLQRDQGHGLMYRGPDYRVETPIENAIVYKASRGFNNSV